MFDDTSASGELGGGGRSVTYTLDKPIAKALVLEAQLADHKAV